MDNVAWRGVKVQAAFAITSLCSCGFLGIWLTFVFFSFCRERLDDLPEDAEDLSFGNSVYKIRFDNRRERPMFGHRYWFYLKDAVDDVPEYIVHWDNFVRCVFLALHLFRRAGN